MCARQLAFGCPHQLKLRLEDELGTVQGGHEIDGGVALRGIQLEHAVDEPPLTPTPRAGVAAILEVPGHHLAPTRSVYDGLELVTRAELVADQKDQDGQDEHDQNRKDLLHGVT